VNPNTLEVVKKKKYPYEANEIILKPYKKGPKSAGYAAEFDPKAVITYHKGLWPFRSIGKRVMLMESAGKCISYENGHTNEADIPIWSRQYEEKLFDANVLKAAGTVNSKTQTSTMLYIIGIAGIIMNVIVLLVITGRLRI
jgi:hypothetical protein